MGGEITYLLGSLVQVLLQQGFQFLLIDGEVADALCQLLGSHGILVLLPTKLGFTQGLWTRLSGLPGLQTAWQFTLATG